MNRRNFLKQTVAAAGALALPTIIPASALGRDGAVAPSNRVTLGCIGTGNMGTLNMRSFLGLPGCRVLAVCDVKRPMREAAAQLVNDAYQNKDCVQYIDYRELLARPEIDAVSIASPDHWHVLHALAAVRAGKDTYVEKPLGMSIDEIKSLRAAIHRHGRVFQFGTWQRSVQQFRLACELVRNGRIGHLQTVKVGVHAGAAERTGLKTWQPEPVPEWLDYESWLGPAPAAPFITQRVSSPYWFHISDYSLGYVAGWGIHHMDIAHWGAGLDGTGPVEVQATAVYPGDDALCDNPLSWDADLLYENGLKIKFTGSGPNFPGVRPGITFEGTEGWVWVNREGIEASSPALLKEKFGPDDARLEFSDEHHQNFINAVQTRGRTVCPIDVAVRSDTACQLTWIAFQLNRKLRWDPTRENFVNDPEASRMLMRAMRAPLHL